MSAQATGGLSMGRPNATNLGGGFGAGFGSAASLSSSSSSDARFAPGVVIAERYRIIGQLGKGGMGEVYRADDMTLGQPVALKFLPEHLTFNKSSLDRMYNELRVARSVSHPNVCRVHDIGVVDGLQFLTMEYVDGEDLGSLLRRIGRFPQDKGLQVARQLCAALTAAHDKGVLHRDLKPANIMLDGRGAVRITDFGLAGLAAELRGKTGRAGTPAYMAPEQFAGLGVTVKSDIYALGLVLYEIFTGKPVYRPESMEELSKLHAQPPPALSTVVPDIDPRIEEVVFRCLDRDPRMRPGSALAVAAALPGGDPLALALAAGETPSPELVAASGGRGSLKPLIALGLLVSVVVGLMVIAGLNSGTKLFARVSLDKSRDELSFTARQIMDKARDGGEPTDRATGFIENRGVLKLGVDSTATEAPAASQPGDQPRGTAAEKLSTVPATAAHSLMLNPAALAFWYRESPVPMVAGGSVPGLQYDDPAMTVPGMGRVILDSQGRLIELRALPTQPALAGSAVRAADPANEKSAEKRGDQFAQKLAEKEEPRATTADWRGLLEHAGLDKTAQPVAPKAVPPTFSDERVAWIAAYLDRPDETVRIEAAALHGKPVYFRVESAPPEQSTPAEADNLMVALAFVLLLGKYALPLGMAWYNVRQGRGDRKGAMRLALVLFGAVVVQRVLGAHYAFTTDALYDGFVATLGEALHTAVFGWGCYMAIEPIIRRERPTTIVSWSRLLSGQWKDPLVGRDLLIGCAIGALWPLLIAALGTIGAAMKLGNGSPQTIDLETLSGLRRATSVLLSIAFSSLVYPLLIAMIEPILVRVIRNPLACRMVQITLLSILFLAIVVWQVGDASNILYVLLALGAGAACGVIVSRFGLLMLVTAFASAAVLSRFPVALNVPVWLVPTAALAALSVVAVSVYGFITSLAGRKLSPGTFLTGARR